MFSKEYIELCKCKKVQELRKDLAIGDWVYYVYSNEIHLVNPDWHFGIFELNNDEIWLPTGDQLDQEIVKICKEKDGSSYQFDYSYRKCPNRFFIPYVATVESRGNRFEFKDTNPLIAKIKLLISLLEANNE
jgi:hypothetical protein